MGPNPSGWLFFRYFRARAPLRNNLCSKGAEPTADIPAHRAPFHAHRSPFHAHRSPAARPGRRGR